MLQFSKGTRPLIVAAALWAATPMIAVAENLADALVGAYETSGLLEQNRALLRAADEGVASAVARLKPVLNYTASITRRLSDSTFSGITTTRNSTTATMTVVAEWLLWDNGRSKLSVQAAQETVLAARAGLLSIEQQILQRAVNAYMNVLNFRETLALRQSNVRLVMQELRAAQDRFEVGEVTRTDVALAEARLAEARSNVTTAEGDLIAAEQEYLVAVGRKPGNLAPPPPLPARPASLDAAMLTTLRQHPAIRRLQHEVASLELQVQAARAGLGPRITLDGAVSTSESRNNQSETDALEFGVNLQQPIYQGGGLSSNIRRAMANRDASRASLKQLERDLRQEVAISMAAYEVAEATIRASRERVRFAEVAFEGVREEATLGARTTLDVLNAEQELLDARTALITAQTRLQVASYRIIASQGALTAESLRLGVPIYDPTEYYNLVKDSPTVRSKQGQQLDRVLQKLGRD